MKKKRKATFVLKDPIFKTSTLFLCGYTHTEMAKRLEKEGVKDLDVDYFKEADGSQMRFTEETADSSFRVVWLRTFEKTPQSIATASHEIFHLVVRICDHKGIPITSEYNADETPAYLHDFYMRYFIGKLLNKIPEW